MTDDRIIDIFEQHGQFVTGKDYALIRTIAEAVAPQRTWVGLTDELIDAVTDAQWAKGINKPIYAAHRAYARAIEAKLKELNQ